MMRLKSDLLAALLATADGVLKTFDLRWRDEVALTVVMAANGYPGSYGKGSEIRGLDKAAAIDGVEIFHAGTRRDGDKILANGGRVLERHGAGQDRRASAGPRLRGHRSDRLARGLLPPRHRLAGDRAREILRDGGPHERAHTAIRSASSWCIASRAGLLAVVATQSLAATARASDADIVLKPAGR